jgi:hypothetical protein
MKSRLEAAGRKLAGDGPRAALDAAYRRTLFEAYCYAKNREFDAHDKRVWVHIGAHKTGSTTVQRLLKRSDIRLRESSVSYDRGGLKLGRRLMWGSPLTETELRELSEFWRRRIQSRRERVTLLSCEGFFGNLYLGYANGLHAARDLRRILDSHVVEIVAVVRRQDRWTESAYQLYVQRGGVETFVEFLHDCGPFPPDWDELLDPWVSLFGRDHMHVHLFETTFRDEVDPLERLFGGLGEPLRHATFRPTRANPGVSEAGLEVLRRCNDILTQQEALKLRKWVSSNMRSVEGYRFFADDERTEFLGRCAESNVRLFRDYFPDADVSLYVPDGATDMAGNHS